MRGTQTVPSVPLDLRAAVGDITAESRTVNLTFTTGADVVRYDWTSGKRFVERLSLDPKHVRMGRLNAGAPLLDSHSAYSLAHQIGVVESAELLAKSGRASVRFSKRADVEPFYQDVLDKIIRNVSVGYKVHRFQDIGEQQDGLPILRAIDWEPFEISMVPMGADASSQVRSSRHVETHPCVIERATNLAHTDADRIRLLQLVKVG